MNIWIFLLIMAACFVAAVVLTIVIGPLYCYGCGKYPENKLSFCEDCIREGQKRGQS